MTNYDEVYVSVNMLTDFRSLRKHTEGTRPGASS